MEYEELHPKVEHFVHRSVDKGWRLKTRTIWNHELVLIIGGHGKVSISGREYKLSAGMLLYFYPDLLHSMAADESYLEFYGVHFSLPPDMDKLPFPEITYVTAPRLRIAFDDLNAAYGQHAYLIEWRYRILLQQIIYTLLVDRQQNSPSDAKRVNRTIDVIRRDIAHRYTIEELCRTAGMKKSLFIRVFKETTGYSPIQYVLKLRIEHAKKLLCDSDAKIEKIAAECGFSDPFYFSRLFKKQCGASPLQFRKSMGGE